MRSRFKIPSRLMARIRADLARPHAFAHERVGFLTAGIAAAPNGDLLLFAREYRPVEEDDYVPDPTVGVKIGGAAMRRAIELAYQPRSALFHVHTHGGAGTPGFSGVDLRSGAEFVPGFFPALSRMPHGMLVLSNDSAAGLIWLRTDDGGADIGQFVFVGAPIMKTGGRA
jgi:hypothetical protein